MGKKTGLRIGYTTGSCATAAAMAAVTAILGEEKREVDIPTPSGKRLRIPILKTFKKGNFARVWVKKDAGDDPDVTHGALICARVSLQQQKNNESIVEIFGGKGVGVVTKPGLPVKIGHAAINPVPREQIKNGVLEVLNRFKVKAKVCVIIEVLEGEKIAKKTLNPRLGIIGGVSILGTRGTVIPYSAEAYKETIILAMDVAKTMGLDHIALTTGGRSERLLMNILNSLPKEAFIQIADFFKFSLECASKKGFKTISFGVFPGKLIKMAQGYEYTHARETKIDFDLLSKWAKEIGYSKEICLEIKKANTGRHVMEIVDTEKEKKIKFIEFLCNKAVLVAKNFSSYRLKIIYHVFDYTEDFIMSYQG